MKKIRVIQKFKDIETGKIRAAGSTFEAKDERVARLLAFEAEHKIKLIEVLGDAENEPDPPAEQLKKKTGKKKGE